MIRRQNLTKEQALQKARHFCAYQERCHSEVRDKLYGFGLRKGEVEEAISSLIEDNYLNEERFAIQFAGGHFRMKHWGRVRIQYELKQRQVGEYCIRKALASIDETTYCQALEKLASTKWEALAEEESRFVRQRKLQEYLWRKGYEPDLTGEIIKQLA